VTVEIGTVRTAAVKIKTFAVVVTKNPSGWYLYGDRGKEMGNSTKFSLSVTPHLCDVNGVTEVPLGLLLPTSDGKELTSSCQVHIIEMRTD